MEMILIYRKRIPYALFVCFQIEPLDGMQDNHNRWIKKTKTFIIFLKKDKAMQENHNCRIKKIETHVIF